MSEPGEDDRRHFDRIDVAVVPHSQTPCIRRPGEEPNIASRPAAPGIELEEFKGGSEPATNCLGKPPERLFRATHELNLVRGQRSVLRG